MRASGENIKIELDRDLTVNYDDNGPVYAPAVIFIHGSPFNKSVWDLQTEVLKNNYRVITYDLRGHGGSTGSAGSFSIDVFTTDLINLMNRLEVEKAILCGLSLGSYIALDAVEKYPGRFNGLVLSGTQCMVDTREVIAEREATIENLIKKGIDHYAEESIRRFFGSRSFVNRKEEVRAARNMILSTPVSSIVNTLRALNNRKEYCSRLGEIKMPVMLLNGREDVITPVSSARNVQDSIRGAVMHIIEYAGHMANLENTHEFNGHLRKFIDEICKSQHLSKHCEDEKTEVRGKRLKV
jgi:pimeloyl-ACP methyl ester carboxylesterase